MSIVETPESLQLESTNRERQHKHYFVPRERCVIFCADSGRQNIYFTIGASEIWNINVMCVCNIHYIYISSIFNLLHCYCLWNVINFLIFSRLEPKSCHGISWALSQNNESYHGITRVVCKNCASFLFIVGIVCWL